MAVVLRVALISAIALSVHSAHGQSPAKPEGPQEPVFSRSDMERIMFLRRNPQKLSDRLTPYDEPLFRPPQAAAEANRVSHKTRGAVMAVDDSWTWIERVLDHEWLPKKEELTYYNGEHRTIDTSRVVWEKDDLRMEMCQTFTRFALKVTPLNAKTTGEDRIKRTEFAKDVCQKLFNDSITVFVPSGDDRVVPEMKQKLLKMWFDPRVIKELSGDKTVIGRAIEGEPRPAVGAGSTPWTGNEDVATSWKFAHYWFRESEWWNDGHAVGFLIQKTEGMSANIPDESLWIRDEVPTKSR